MANTAKQMAGPQTGERWNPVREEAETLASALPPLLVAAEQLASAIVLGVHGRRKAGMGETFWQFRRYSVEDPSTAIDWRQSAKSQHLFVREREWEVSESVWFWRDGSPGMRFASARDLPAKIDRATVLTLALASLLVRGGERIALLDGDSPPAMGRVALRRIAHRLADLPPSDAGVPPEGRVSRSGTLVWMTQIIDPAEEDFPFTGRVRFEASATPETTMFGRVQNVRGNYKARYAAHAEAVGAMARRLGWSFLRHRTDKAPQTVLIALYGAIGGTRAMRGF
jgi:uncharacterized protein (DUF58 family)